METGTSADRTRSLTAFVLTVTGAAMTGACAIANPESLHHFDDLTHYLFAKWAWIWPTYLIDEWGRPGFTVLYFLPAGLSWTACRLLSTALTAASAWLAFRIAERAGLRSAWAVIPLCYAQPLFFQLAQTTLTETPLAFYLTLAVYLAQRGRWSWSAAFISLATVTRHEAAVFVPLWMVLACRSRHWLEAGSAQSAIRNPQSAIEAAPPATGGQRYLGCDLAGLWRLWPLLWAPVVVNITALAVHMVPGVVRLFEPKPSSMYGQGGWLTFFSRSMEAFGPAVMVLAIVGAFKLARVPRGRIVVACAVAYFTTHTAIRALGLFNSGGYARFLVPISPLVAIIALAGWSRLRSAEAGDRRTANFLAAGAMILLWLAMERQLALYAARLDEAAELPAIVVGVWAVRSTTALLALLAIVAAGFTTWSQHRLLSEAPVSAAILAVLLLTSWQLCRPLAKPHAGRIIEETFAWAAAEGLRDREVFSANMWGTYATGRVLPPLERGVRDQLDLAPPGSLLFWDEQFGPPEDDSLRIENLLANPSYRLIHRSRPLPHSRRPYLLVFEKLVGRGSKEGQLPDPGTEITPRHLANPQSRDYHADTALAGGVESAPARGPQP